MARPLLTAYPLLAAALPHVALGELPTPVEELPELAAEIGAGRFFVKRDDVSGAVYGGNKVRKLEFLLADALRQGAASVMTFGCAGSNHATATAVYARQLGLHAISMLLPQPNAHSVRRNLLLSHRHGAELHYYGDARRVSLGVALVRLRHRLTTGRIPYTIPAGGSSPLGTVGFVNAAHELRDQIAAGQAPEPDCIYVAAGTAGTAAGLMIGLRAAGLKTAVIPVRVTGEAFMNTERFLALLRDTAALLRHADPAYPAPDFAPGDIGLRHDFYGEQYALYSPESVGAVERFRARGIRLEGTYTGKAAAALIHDGLAGALRGKTVMLWNTYNSRDVAGVVAGDDYHALPKAFHRYFETDVQPLDRAPTG